ncbi:hypothetical protein HYY69_07760 [Candidatus Woesearchaeota archaeon]|nr:hypothetical protein [Candidatus Woesearchaeota archaeon]
MGLLLPTITLSLGELFTFDNEHRETSFNTVTITFIDVSEDDRSCVFKINGKIVVIERHQNYDGEGFSIWVRDAYPVRDQSGTKDVCLAVISGIVTGKKEIIEVKPKLFTNNTENNDTTSIALDNKGSNKEDKFSDQSQPLAPQETLPQPQQQGKNIFYRIVRWIFSFIW